MGKLKGEIEDAAFPYAYPKEYAQVEEIIKEKQESYQKNLVEVREELEKTLKKNKIKFIEIDYRVKHKYSLYKKLLKYNFDLDKINDIVALRVVVHTLEECYQVLGLVHSIWNPLPGRIKDYIALPKPNGYRSIHTTIFTGLGGIAEIQIRTKDMHAEAAYGIAAHFAYKEQGVKKVKGDKDKFKWIEELKELNYNPDDPKNFIDHLKMDFFNDRIFVFTPEGDVVDLPEDSTPIDFAYSIHTDIGDHIFGAKINRKMSQIFTKLKNGDIVEISTRKDSKPSGKWLEFVKTTVAKKHIKSYLEKNSLLSKLMSFGRN
jgi:GTP pyrophosphokinase